MKLLLLGSTAFAALAFTAPAWAQSYAPTHDWNGFYLGAQLGYGMGKESWRQTTSNFALPLDSSVKDVSLKGFTGGVQGGWDWQKDNLLLGIQGDWTLNDQIGSADHVVFTSYSGETDNPWTATLTGRAGYAFRRSVMYVKGGGAWAHEKSVIKFNGEEVTNHEDKSRTGWVLGAGVETELNPHWTGGLEYDYMHFGTKHATFDYFAHPAGLIEGWDLKARNQVVKAVFNYHFH